MPNRAGAGHATRRAQFFFPRRRRHTRFDCDWSSDVCSSDLYVTVAEQTPRAEDFPGAPPESLVPGSVVFSPPGHAVPLDRKSTRLNSSHSQISYAVFCLKKKKKKKPKTNITKKQTNN